MIYKTIIISFSFVRGGAGVSAARFNDILSSNAQSDSVDLIHQDNAGMLQLFKRVISFILVKFQFDNNPIKHSLNLFSFKPVLKAFENSKDTLYHLHWINNDTLSIFDFGKIPSGSVITLHDEWLYCGAEHHYSYNDNSKDFIHGYSYLKKGVLGIHWNSLIWSIKYKKLFHRRDLIFTTPSRWMYNRAKSSLILKNCDVRLLPNPINTDIFKPYPKDDAKKFRRNLHIDDDCFVLVFAASTKKYNKLKGINLLYDALKLLQSKKLKIPISKIILINFGGLKGDAKLYSYRNISIGHIDNEIDLAKIYSIADCVVVPSMFESFGQVSAEAISCCSPVVCFDTSGLRDIIINNYNGLIAKSFTHTALCSEIANIINLPKKIRLEMGHNGRKHVLEKFSYPIITKQYLNILKDASELKKI